MAEYTPEMRAKLAEYMELKMRVAEYRKLLARHAPDQQTHVIDDSVNKDASPS
jgi:hypothetical protein